MATIEHTFTVTFQISKESFEHNFPTTQRAEEDLSDSLLFEKEEIIENIEDAFNGLHAGEFQINEVSVVDNE